MHDYYIIFHHLFLILQAVLYDVIIKNFEKIKQPRSSHTTSLYWDVASVSIKFCVWLQLARLVAFSQYVAKQYCSMLWSSSINNSIILLCNAWIHLKHGTCVILFNGSDLFDPAHCLDPVLFWVSHYCQKKDDDNIMYKIYIRGTDVV